MSALGICKNSRSLRLGTALVLGLGLSSGLLWLMGVARQPAMALDASAAIRYVDGAAGQDDGNDCTTSTLPCATVQHAVDVAASGDEIRVAMGIYTGVHARVGITQVVYISKSVTLRGGYTATNWTTSYPITQPTALDAETEGRVLYIGGDISPTVEGLHITGGDAAGLGGSPSGDSGGGVLVVGAAVTMSNNHVFSNTAAFGGGLYFLSSAKVLLTHNTISNNTGEGLAGGLYVRFCPGAKLIDNTIRDNVADHQGGGQKHYGGALVQQSDNATLLDNLIIGNRAADQCGGVCFGASPNALLVGNIITGNSGGSPGFPRTGGGLQFVDSTGARLDGNTVTHNSAIGVGAGLYLERSDVTLTNNVIADNQLASFDSFEGSGSGLYIAGSSPRLLHTTIARNGGGDGSGVYITDIFGRSSDVIMTNTILVSHTVGITVTAGNTVTLNGVLWYSNTRNYGGPGTVAVTHEVTGNPAFAADGYHLTSVSAAIDKGVNAGVDDDIDGHARPQGGGYDLGADELLTLYLPLVLRNP